MKFKEIINFENLNDKSINDNFDMIFENSVDDTSKLKSQILLYLTTGEKKIKERLQYIEDLEATDETIVHIVEDLLTLKELEGLEENSIQNSKSGNILEDGVDVKKSLSKKVTSTKIDSISIMENQINNELSKRLLSSSSYGSSTTFILSDKNQTAKDVIVNKISSDLNYEVVEIDMTYFASDEEINNIFGSDEDLSFLEKELGLNSDKIILFKNIDKAPISFFDRLQDIRKERKIKNISLDNVLFILETEKIIESRDEKSELLKNKDLFRELNRRNFISFKNTTDLEMENIGMFLTGEKNGEININGINIKYDDNFFEYVKRTQKKYKNIEYREVNEMIMYNILEGFVNPYFERNEGVEKNITLSFELNEGKIIIKNEKKIILEINIEKKFYKEEFDFEKFSDSGLQRNLSIIESRLDKKKDLNSIDLKINNSPEGIYLMDGYKEQKDEVLKEINEKMKKEILTIDMSKIKEESDFFKLIGYPLGFEPDNQEESEEKTEEELELEEETEKEEAEKEKEKESNMNEKELEKYKEEKINKAKEEESCMLKSSCVSINNIKVSEKEYSDGILKFIIENPNTTLIFEKTENLNPKFQAFLEVVLETGKYSMNNGEIIDFTKTMIIIDKELDITQEIKEEEIEDYKEKREEETFNKSKLLIEGIENLDFYSLDLKTIFEKVQLGLKEYLKEIKSKEGITIEYSIDFLIGLTESAFDHKDGLEYLEDDIKIFVDESLQGVKRTKLLKSGNTIHLEFDLKNSIVTSSDSIYKSVNGYADSHFNKLQNKNKREREEIESKRKYLREVALDDIDYSYSISSEFDDFFEENLETFEKYMDIEVNEYNKDKEKYMDNRRKENIGKYINFQKTDIDKSEFELFLKFYSSLEEYINKPDIEKYFDFIKNGMSKSDYMEWKLIDVLISEHELYPDDEQVKSIIDKNSNVIIDIQDPEKTMKTVFLISQFLDSGINITEETFDFLIQNGISLDENKDLVKLLSKNKSFEKKFLSMELELDEYLLFLKTIEFDIDPNNNISYEVSKKLTQINITNPSENLISVLTNKSLEKEFLSNSESDSIQFIDYIRFYDYSLESSDKLTFKEYNLLNHGGVLSKDVIDEVTNGNKKLLSFISKNVGVDSSVILKYVRLTNYEVDNGEYLLDIKSYEKYGKVFEFDENNLKDEEIKKIINENKNLDYNEEEVITDMIIINNLDSYLNNNEKNDLVPSEIMSRNKLLNYISLKENLTKNEKREYVNLINGKSPEENFGIKTDNLNKRLKNSIKNENENENKEIGFNENKINNIKNELDFITNNKLKDSLKFQMYLDNNKDIDNKDIDNKDIISKFKKFVIYENMDDEFKNKLSFEIYEKRDSFFKNIEDENVSKVIEFLNKNNAEIPDGFVLNMEDIKKIISGEVNMKLFLDDTFKEQIGLEIFGNNKSIIDSFKKEFEVLYPLYSSQKSDINKYKNSDHKRSQGIPEEYFRYLLDNKSAAKNEVSMVEYLFLSLRDIDFEKIENKYKKRKNELSKYLLHLKKDEKVLVMDDDLNKKLYIIINSEGIVDYEKLDSTFNVLEEGELKEDSINPWKKVNSNTQVKIQMLNKWFSNKNTLNKNTVDNEILNKILNNSDNFEFVSSIVSMFYSGNIKLGYVNKILEYEKVFQGMSSKDITSKLISLVNSINTTQNIINIEIGFVENYFKYIVETQKISKKSFLEYKEYEIMSEFSELFSSSKKIQSKMNDENMRKNMLNLISKSELDLKSSSIEQLLVDKDDNKERDVLKFIFNGKSEKKIKEYIFEGISTDKIVNDLEAVFSMFSNYDFDDSKSILIKKIEGYKKIQKTYKVEFVENFLNKGMDYKYYDFCKIVLLCNKLKIRKTKENLDKLLKNKDKISFLSNNGQYNSEYKKYYEKNSSIFKSSSSIYNDFNKEKRKELGVNEAKTGFELL